MVEFDQERKKRILYYSLTPYALKGPYPGGIEMLG
jgi:hypothetical protein